MSELDIVDSQQLPGTRGGAQPGVTRPKWKVVFEERNRPIAARMKQREIDALKANRKLRDKRNKYDPRNLHGPIPGGISIDGVQYKWKLSGPDRFDGRSTAADVLGIGRSGFEDLLARGYTFDEILAQSSQRSHGASSAGRRSTHLLTYRGEEWTLADLGRHLDKPYNTILAYAKEGRSGDEIAAMEPRRRGRPKKSVAEREAGNLSKS